jgi:phage-related protein
VKDTRKLYTNNPNPAKVPTETQAQEKLVRLAWEPTTHETLCGFPEGPKKHLGYQLWLVQKGEIPPESSPVPGISGVFELRDEDGRAWYRVIHTKNIEGTVYVLHCFEKQSNRIEKKDIRTIETRLGNLNNRLSKERPHGNEGAKKKAPRNVR